MTRDFNKAISYKGNFDISDILTNLRRLRSELQTPKNQNSFFDIDKEIRNIESFSTKIQASIQKGFTNPQDLKEFEKLNKSLETSYSRVSVGLKDISLKNLKTEAEDLEKVCKKQQQTLKNIVREEKERISTQLEGLKSAKLQKEYAKQLTDAAKNGEDLSDVQKTINEELSKRIQLQKQLKTEAEGSVRKQESSLLDAKNSATSLSTMGTRSFTTKGTTENVNKGQLNQIQNAYRGVLQDANTKTPEQAFKKITKALDDLGFSVKNNDTLMKNINTSFSEVDNNVKPLEKSLQEARKEVEEYDRGISNLEKNQNVLNTVFSDSSSSGLVESYRKTQVAARDVEKAQIALNVAQQESNPNITLLQQLDATMEKHARTTKEATNETKQLSQSQMELEETFAKIGQSAKYFFSLYNGLNLIKQTVVKTFNDVQDLDKAFAGIAMVSNYELGDLWKKYDSYAEMAKELGQETKDVIAASSLFIQQGLEMEEALSLTESTMTLATLAGSNFESATQQMTSALRGFNMEMNEGARVTDVYSELAAKAAADVDGIANAMSRTASIAASSGMSFENTSAFLTQMIEVTQESPENLGTALKSIIARFQELKENVAGTEESAFDDLDYNNVDKALKSVGISIKDSSGQFRDLDEVFLELSGKFQSLDRNTQRYISTIAAGSRQQSRFIALMSDHERLLELIDTAYDSAGRSSEQFSKYQDTLEYRVKQISNSWEQLRTNFLDSDVYRNALDVLNNFLSKVNDMSAIDFVAIGATFLILGKTVITSIMQGLQGSAGVLLNFVGKKIDVVKNYAKKKLSEKTSSTGVLSKLLGLEDLSSIDSQIALLKLKIQNFRKQMESLPSMDFIDEQNAIADLEMIRAEIMKLKASDRNMALQYLSENYKAGSSESANLYIKTQLAKDLLGNQESEKLAMQQRGQLLGNVFATSFTTAITIAVTEDDPMKALGKSMLSSVIAITPMIANQFLLMGTEITAKLVIGTLGAAAIVFAITAALTAATVGIKYLVENAGVDKLQKKIDEQEKRVEELQKKIDETKNSLSESRESEKSAKKLRIEFTKLNEKQVLTTEEQEKYNSLVEEIRSNYPEVVTYYNEITGELRTQNDLWDNILEKMTLATKEDASELYLQQAKYAAASIKSVDLAVDKQKRELGELDVSNKEFEWREGASHKTVENDTFQKRLQDGIARANIGNHEYNSAALLRSYQTDGNGETFIDIDRLAPFFGSYDTSDMSEEEWDNLLSQMSDADDEGWKMVESYISDVTKNIDETADRQKGFIEDQRKAALVSNIQAQTGENVAVSTYIAEEFEKSDKNVEFTPLKGSGWGNNLAEWDDLTEDQRKILATTEDFSNEHDYNENRRHGAKIKRLEAAYEEAAKIYIEKMAIEFATELSPSQKEAISDFTANANEYSLEQLEGEEGQHYINILGDSETAKQQVQEYKDAINEALMGGEGVEKGGLSAYIVEEFNPEDAINEVVDKFKNTPSLDEFTEYYKSWGLKNIQAFISAIENVPESQRDEYGKALHNFFASENLTEEQAGVLFSVNLENLDVLGLEEAKETYIDSLIEMGSSTGEAEEIWKGFIDTVANYGSNLSITSVVGAEEFITKIGEVRATATEAWGAIKAAQDEFFEKGNLSIENMNALIEAGYEDFIKITSSGIQLDTSGMMSFYFDSVSNGTELLDQQILFNEQKEIERKLRIANLKLEIEELKLAGVLTPAQQESLDALEEELLLEESLAISSREATQKLRNQRSLMELTDVQSVIEAMDDFNDRVQKAEDNEKKLKKSSEDAAKSVEDLKKALNDAEQALEEAKHGTQDFRSGLDGLINYTTKLNDLNRSINNIKTSLEDVSNVSEAGDLLEQLSSSYTDKEVTLGAESLVVDDALANLQSTLEQNFGQFISFQDGQAIIDFSYQQMDDNDELKKAFEEEFDLWNEYKNESNDIQDEIQAIQKERVAYQEEVLKNYVTLQEDLISTLKSLSQEEVDTIKAKYDAIEEADNKYLDALSDAIEKQRKLRDLETSYSDLAAKEKQLALMQRDTSGANQSEIQSLADEIDTDRQKLLDTEVDNLIDSLKELYEQQKEARDAEIEYMETVTESADHFAQWAQEIMATWTSAEDMSDWYLQNNPDVQDMTVEQTEAYLNELSKNYSAYAQYNALQATNFTTEQESLNTAIQAMYNNTSENVSDIGTITQNTAQEAAEKIKLEAQEALDDANEKLTKGKEDAQTAYEEWKTAEEALEKSRLDSINATADGIQKLIDLSETLSTTAATAYAISSVANFDNADLSDTTSAKNMATKYGLGSDTEGYKNSFIQAVHNAGGDISQYPNSTGIIKDQQGANIVYGGHAVIWGNGSTEWYNSKEEADAALANAQRSVNSLSDYALIKGAKAYKNGGLVDYTGPAWVDGTPSDPESFLDSEDTARIGAAAKLFSDLPLLNKNNVDKDIVSSNVGDISVEIHLNVAELSNDYDTGQMMDKVKKEIVKSLASTGVPVILNK